MPEIKENHISTLLKSRIGLHFDQFQDIQITVKNSYICMCFEAINKNNKRALELLAKVIDLDKKYKIWAKTDQFLHIIKEMLEFKKLVGENSKKQKKKS